MSDYNQTGMMTPEQYQRQNAARNGLNQRIGQQRYQYEMGADPNPGAQTKGKSMSKMLINVAFIAILSAGIVGSFWDAFDMDKFVSFMEVFAYVWAPLVVAVGGGRAFKNWTEKRYHPNEGQTAVPGSEITPPE